jgi:NAD(P)-dependent dehydrogenase (short-subunit alcohol dehydrogenase family)
VIIGGSRGIALALAKVFAHEEYSLVITGSRSSQIESRSESLVLQSIGVMVGTTIK